MTTLEPIPLDLNLDLKVPIRTEPLIKPLDEWESLAYNQSTTTPDYYGISGAYNNGGFDWYLESIYTQTVYYFAAGQSFTFTATGLKPLSKHTFTFDGIDQSSKCQPFGKNPGDDLVTDANGQISFTFYYDSGLESQYTDYSYAQSLINNLAGDKVCVLSTSNSSAYKTIRILKGSDFETQTQTTVTTQPAITISASTSTDYTWTENPAGAYGWYNYYDLS